MTSHRHTDTHTERRPQRKEEESRKRQSGGRDHGSRPMSLYSLLIFMPGKLTDGGPLFPSAKLVVLGRPLMVEKIHTRREHDKSLVSFHDHCGISTRDGGGRSIFCPLSHTRSLSLFLPLTLEPHHPRGTAIPPAGANASF